MKIIIKNSSDLPIYEQIEEQIKEQILSGEIAEGETLPSIRKLAKETGVSVITTTRAYSDLTEQGFIASIPGKGCVVLSRDNALLKEQYLKRIETGLASAIGTAKLLGMDRTELGSILDLLWDEED